MLRSAYEGLNARPKVYLSKEYFCEMYPTCVSSKLCEFIPVPVLVPVPKCTHKFLGTCSVQPLLIYPEWTAQCFAVFHRLERSF